MAGPARRKGKRKMESAVFSRLQSVQLGEPQLYKNIAIVPLVAPGGVFQYNTLGEALANSSLVVTEVSSAGSVPELMVANRGNQPVLLIDGEELAGAKQNRVLNVSILIKATSETKIPVSCTEQGRWAYASKEFADSGNVLAYKSRSHKSSSVHRSLELSGSHMSDQGQVWEDIAELHHKAGSQSRTHAMSDVYKARQDDLRKCDETFKAVPNQIGLVAFINGRPAGADIVSLGAAYAKLHPKLVRSYTLEGLLEQKPEARPPEALLGDARQFLDEIAVAEQSQFPSIGHGTEYRYKSKHLAGSALVHANELIHAAFFRLEEVQEGERMASYLHRRRFSRE